MKTRHSLFFILFAPILLTIIGFGIYSNTLHAPFVLDDSPNILENPYIRMTSIRPDKLLQIIDSPSPRPVANFTFALNYYFHQLHPFGYHAVNILIHIITAILIFLVMTQTLRLLKDNASCFMPLAATLLWLVHPVHTQSVTYVVQRMTAMSTMFYLLALLCYIKARSVPQGTPGQRIKIIVLVVITVLAGFLGLLSKQIIATLPVFLFLYEWFFIRQLDISKLKIELKKQIKWIVPIAGLFLVLSLVYLGDSPVEKILRGYAKRDFTPCERLLTQPGVVVFYISLLFFPHPARLNLDHDFPLSQGFLSPETTILAIIALLALLIGTIVAARRHRLPAFAIIWFLGNLIIESSVIGLELIFEHRVYLPSIFPVMAVTWLLLNYLKPQPLSRLLLIALICLLGAWTFQRNSVWSDNLSLWRDCVDKSPQKARPNNNLGLVYKNAKGTDKALIAFQKSLSINPAYDEALNNVGQILHNQGDYSGALSYFQRAIEVNANRYQSYFNIGRVLFDMGEREKALRLYKKALEIHPLYEKSYNNIGFIYLKNGELEKAVGYFQRAIEINPQYEKAYNNIGTILRANGQAKAALAYFKKAIALNPGYADAHYNMGMALSDMQQMENAIKLYKKTLTIDPLYAKAHNNIGIILQKQNIINESIAHFQQALAIAPDFEKAWNNIGISFFRQGDTDKAAASFQKALSINPSYVDAKNNLSAIQKAVREKQAGKER